MLRLSVVYSSDRVIVYETLYVLIRFVGFSGVCVGIYLELSSVICRPWCHENLLEFASRSYGDASNPVGEFTREGSKQPTTAVGYHSKSSGINAKSTYQRQTAL